MEYVPWRAETDPERPLPEWIWCVVGNIREYTLTENAVQRGDKQFAPGAKVYICPSIYRHCFPAPSDKVRIIGKPRRSDKLICIIARIDHLENIRVKRIFDKRVIKSMLHGNIHAYPDGTSHKEYISGFDDTERGYEGAVRLAAFLERETRSYGYDQDRRVLETDELALDDMLSRKDEIIGRIGQMRYDYHLDHLKRMIKRNAIEVSS